jgi:hypothetical protein
MDQVDCRQVTAEQRVRSQFGSCGICGEPKGIEAGFSTGTYV